MVPVELLYTAMLSGFAVALTGMIATIRVLGSRITDVRAVMTSLRTDVRADMISIRGEIGGLRKEFTGEIGGLRKEVTGEIGGLRSEFNTRFDDVTEQLTTVRASLGAIDARLGTLEQQR